MDVFGIDGEGEGVVEAVLELSPAGRVSSLSFPVPMSLTRVVVRGRLAGLLGASSLFKDNMF